MPSTLSTVLLEEPPEQLENVDGTAAALVTDQYAAVYRCNVRDCDQPAVIHDPMNTEEEKRRYGLWCEAHQLCYENLVFGELLDPPYPRVALSVCSALCEGHASPSQCDHRQYSGVQARGGAAKPEQGRVSLTRPRER